MVACLDGSELAERALPFAADLAQRLAAELVLVRVVPVQDRQPARAITRYVGDRGDSLVSSPPTVAAAYAAP